MWNMEFSYEIQLVEIKGNIQVSYLPLLKLRSWLVNVTVTIVTNFCIVKITSVLILNLPCRIIW
jgi:hypothetical protein